MIEAVVVYANVAAYGVDAARAEVLLMRGYEHLKFVVI